MFDSIDVGEIPAGAAAVAGYVNGRWPTEAVLEKRFPKAFHLSIAVTSSADADCLDVEQGDATNDSAVPWFKRQLDRGLKHPKLYTSVSNVEALRARLKAAGFDVPYDDLWSAHYSYRPHLCGPACGFNMRGTVGATQWTNRYAGRNLDASLVTDAFFSKAPVATVEPVPVGEAKNQSPFTRAVWPVPLPNWFWTWNQWLSDGKAYPRPADAPRIPPAWAWVRRAALH